MSPEVRHPHDGVEPSEGLDGVLEKKRTKEEKEVSFVELDERREGLKRREAHLSEAQRPLEDVLSFNFDLVGCRVNC